MNRVKPSEYASLCGVTVGAIYNRIKSGSLDYETVYLPDDTVRYFIDAIKNPPERLGPKGIKLKNT
jgi:hypothetical protein